MKILTSGKAKRIILALAGLAALGGCAVVPYDGYYNQPVYTGAAVYAAPPVYVAPAINFGFQYRSGRGHYGHGHGHGHGRYRGHR